MKPQWHGRAGEFLAAATAQGLMVLMAGPNVIRFVPSLIIDEDDIVQGMAKFANAVAQVVNAAN